MSTRPLIAIPIRSFGSAKQRLAPVLAESTRRDLAMAMAERTIDSALALTDAVGVVTANEAVGEWALGLGAGVIGDPGRGLDASAATAARFATGADRRWLITHADIPTVTEDHLATVIACWPEDGFVVVPSFDGGTPVLGGSGGFAFSYGPGSFHRHLAAMSAKPHRVLAHPGLAVDLDSPEDLNFLRRWRPSSWIDAIVEPAA
jgi:2-phospho-L-lactate guanylyltransferase